MMKVNIICSFVYRGIILTKKGGVFERLLLKLRKLILKVMDPPALVTMSNGKRIYIPFSHELPIYKKYHPSFMTNLQSVAKIVKRERKILSCLDIGGNIGDSILEIDIKDADYLLVEGEKAYSSFIKENLILNGFCYNFIKTDKRLKENGGGVQG